MFLTKCYHSAPVPLFFGHGPVKNRRIREYRHHRLTKPHSVNVTQVRDCTLSLHVLSILEKARHAGAVRCERGSAAAATAARARNTRRDSGGDQDAMAGMERLRGFKLERHALDGRRRQQQRGRR